MAWMSFAISYVRPRAHWILGLWIKIPIFIDLFRPRFRCCVFACPETIIIGRLLQRRWLHLGLKLELWDHERGCLKGFTNLQNAYFDTSWIFIELTTTEPLVSAWTSKISSFLLMRPWNRGAKRMQYLSACSIFLATLKEENERVLEPLTRTSITFVVNKPLFFPGK